ncbi:MAG: triose-phosphate isomerase [Desulfovibrio sp.]|nr:triose-phosphate isomerase [Desulfovibrio sp.]
MKTIIAANWKMNKVRSEAQKTAKALREGIQKASLPSDRSVFVFPPFLSLDVVAEAFQGQSKTVVGAQNFYPAASGAFTGEVSLDMLKDCGATWVLVGHSERRHVLHEDNALIAEKTRFALEHGFGVMLCIGETLEEREAGKLQEVLSSQLSSALAPLGFDRDRMQDSCIIAYEPVWAIGTGKVAGEAEVTEAHALVKDILASVSQATKDLPVLYGGSVKPSNAHSLLQLANVDGLLVGGASLEAESFLQIITA